MPSPVAHSLIGLAVGAAWLAPRASSARSLCSVLWKKRLPLSGCVLLANVPDIDYLPGILAGDFNRFHHYFTHTPGWCLLVAAGVWCGLRALRGERLLTLVWLLALLFSHLAADYVTEDRRAPFGIMALWPVSDSFHLSPVQVFLHLKKDRYADFLQWHNVRAGLLEVAWCLPLLVLAVWRCWLPRVLEIAGRDADGL